MMRAAPVAWQFINQDRKCQWNFPIAIRAKTQDPFVGIASYFSPGNMGNQIIA
jgi:hypothetical protein